MPIYLYENKDGKIVQEIVSVEDRDNRKGLTRVPSAPYIHRGVSDPNSSAEGARRFYREYEEKGKLTSRKFSKSRIKKIWNWS